MSMTSTEQTAPARAVLIAVQLPDVDPVAFASSIAESDVAILRQNRAGSF